MVCTYIYTQCNSTQLLKNKGNPVICNNIWMDLEGIMLSEVSQTEKDKHCLISLICGISAHRFGNRLVVARAGGKGRI